MINGIGFFAQRINKKDFKHMDLLECKMQIFNLSRHLKKGTRRADTRDLIFKENLETSQLDDEEMENYWFYKTTEELEKVDFRNPRIQQFKEVGWAEPFASVEEMRRRQKMIDSLMSTLKANLKKQITDATRDRLTRNTFKEKMKLMVNMFTKRHSGGALSALDWEGA